MNNIYSFLNTNNIHYERFDHPGVFTCEQARELCPQMPGTSIKNLFLYDKRTEQHFLVVVPHCKRVDLKQLKNLLNVSNLSFASEERLQKYLGVTPGSVTILGLINDTTHAITVIFDMQLKDQTLQCHPLINTATLAIPFEDIKKFLSLTQHDYQFLNIPAR
jgi:Ala-tRNA(Pro) deacylase